jgi:uncharacterized protein (UPF0261 family)
VAQTGKKKVVLVGTFDTKGRESAFIKGILETEGFQVIAIDVGTGSRENSLFVPDYPSKKVAEEAGKTIEEIVTLARQAKSQEWTGLMAEGASRIAQRLYAAGLLDGIISFGGNAGTSLGTLVMKSLPFGVPKVMYSTVASGNTRPYIGTKDICMIPSIADIVGLNCITRTSLTRAAGALAGMIKTGTPPRSDKPLIGVTEIGRLADNGPRIISSLEEKGYEVVFFHGVGTGGQALEDMIGQDLISGLLDLSLNEVMDHLHGGFCDAGPDRLMAAARKRIPTVVAPGYANRIVFPSREAVPPKFADRDIWRMGVTLSIVPASKDEMRQLASVIAEKLNAYDGPLVVLLPMKGLSSPKERFDFPEINEVFFSEIRRQLKPAVSVKDLDLHVLDAQFADEAVKILLDMMQKSGHALSPENQPNSI